MTVIPKFKVTAGADGLNSLLDINVDGGLEVHPLGGIPGQFTPNLPSGLYPIEDGMYLLQSIPFVVDGAGKLHGAGGVELLARTPDIQNLQWQVSFATVVINGRKLSIPSWWFNARDADSIWALEDLVSVRKANAAWLGRGRSVNITSGHFNEDGDLVLINEDGTPTTVIHPAPGTLVAIDHPNGTMSIG